MSPAPAAFEFTVQFFDQQIGSQLSWDIGSSNGKGRNPYHTEGRHNGAIHLDPGDRLALVVRGTGESAGRGFRIVQAALVMSSKSVDLGLPSPFGASGNAVPAMVFGDEDFDTGTVPGGQEAVKTLRRPLDVSAGSGRWGLSIVLAVEIAGAEPARRVFRLDPEVQIGNGT